MYDFKLFSTYLIVARIGGKVLGDITSEPFLHSLYTVLSQTEHLEDKNQTSTTINENHLIVILHIKLSSLVSDPQALS